MSRHDASSALHEPAVPSDDAPVPEIVHGWVAPPVHRPAPAGLVAAGALMTMSSAFGQTYFIAIFAPQLKHELGLSDGSFGTFFTVATIASAATMMATGKLADRFRIRWLAAATMTMLAVLCVAMASITSAWVLLPILYGLRLCGQGYPGHLAVTGAARWYHRRRGRMISLALLGFPTGEAIVPVVAVTLVAVIGWRATWLVGAAYLVCAAVPLILLILRHEPAHDHPPPAKAADAPVAVRQWTHAEVLRRPEFYAVVAGVSTPSFVMTGIFFHQAYLAEAKGWSMGWFTGWIPLYAGVNVAVALATGWLVDRFGAVRLLPFILIPMAAGVLAPTLSDSPLAVPAMMALGALTTGSAGTVIGAIWAELFGTRHLGAIRSTVVAGQVLSSALAPGLIGIMLDMGVRLELQFGCMVAYTLASAVVLAVVAPRLRRLSAGA